MQFLKNNSSYPLDNLLYILPCFPFSASSPISKTSQVFSSQIKQAQIFPLNFYGQN